MYKNNDSSPKISNNIPNIKVKLFPHQLSSIYSLKEWEKNPSCSLPVNNSDYNYKMFIRCGFYCDPVGIGKTLSILTFLMLFDAPDIPDVRPIQSNNIGSVIISTKQYFSKFKYLKSNIIIVPHGLVSHWSDQVVRWINKEYIRNNIKIIYLNKHIDNLKIDELPNIVICSSTRWRRLGELLASGYLVERIIYDEADNIKIPCNPEVKAKFYWMISSTPELWNVKVSGFLRDIYFKISFLTRSQKFMNPENRHKYKGLFIESEMSYIRKSMRLPDVNYKFIKCRLDRNSAIFGDFMSVNIKNALENGDTTSVLNYFGCTDYEGLVNNVTNDILNKIKKLKKTREYFIDISRDISDININIKNLENKYKGLLSRISNNSCPICYDTINENKSVLPCCNNVFCFKCILNVLSTTSKCPLCRSELLVPDIKVYNNNINQIIPKNRTRWEELSNILVNLSEKILIFSDHNFDMVKKIIFELNITFSELKGSVNHIKKILKKYRSGEIGILLLNSKYQAHGHHLPETEHVIIMHDVSIPCKEQIVGRAQRYGRIIPLNVIILDSN